MNSIKRICKQICSDIETKYSNVSTKIEDYGDEYFIVINNQEIFDSNEYANYMLELTEKYLWNKGIYNVLFSYSKDV